MEIHSETRIAKPLDVVFAAYRDRLPEAVGFMPDVRAIEVLKRDEDGAVVKLHNVWKSDKEVPGFAARILKPEHLHWDDYATWNSDGYFCDWVIKPRAFTSSVDCSGRTRLIADGEDATRVVLSGNLLIDLKSIPGVPRLLAGKLKPRVEKLIVSLIAPNLKQTNLSLERFLESQ